MSEESAQEADGKTIRLSPGALQGLEALLEYAERDREDWDFMTRELDPDTNGYTPEDVRVGDAAWDRAREAADELRDHIPVPEPDKYERVGFAPTTGIYLPPQPGWGVPGQYTTVRELFDPGDKMAPEYQQVVEDLVGEGYLPPQRPSAFQVDFDDTWQPHDEEVLACLSRADIEAVANNPNAIVGVYPARVEASRRDGGHAVRVGRVRELPSAQGQRELAVGFGGDWQPDRVAGEDLATTMEILAEEFGDVASDGVHSNEARAELWDSGWKVVSWPPALEEEPESVSVPPGTVWVARTDGRIPEIDHPQVDLDAIWDATINDRLQVEQQALAEQQAALSPVQPQSPNPAGPGLS